jgi:AraC-like DNA-binding protein
MEIGVRPPKLLIIDCCQHIVDELETALAADRTSVLKSSEFESFTNGENVGLIVVGTPPAPLRRLFLSRLRRFFPLPPILVLRKEQISIDSDEEILRGEFLLSDHKSEEDLAIVSSAREVLPMAPCEHTRTDSSFELVKEVTRVLADNFSDADLDLEQVADELSVSPTRLSRVLNREVHVSFRQMLRQVRIEEAKRLLATSRLSVKEIAARVGFSDSHYFSRIFKEMTGERPTEYTFDSNDLVFN